MSDNANRIREIVAEQLGVEIANVKNESNFYDDLGADSLDAVELMMAFEDEFDVSIPEEEADSITTIQKAIDYIEKLQNAD